jgi:hypothetical protein
MDAGEDPPDSGAPAILTRAIDPVQTSTAIVATIGDHFVAVGPPSAARGSLFLFYPGTGTRPDQYTRLLTRAAELGYHSIGMAYHNEDAINFDICPGQPPTCHERARLEVLTGVESGYDPPAVDRDNSAFERLRRLLLHLHRSWPDEGWDQYLTAGEEIEWARVAFAGHSQGGGHAAMTAKLHRVARVILFGATEPMAWTAATFATPRVAFFGFVHTEEPSFAPIIRSWENLMIPGTLTSTDDLLPPYADSHRLSTSILACSGDPQNRVYFHNCPVVDEYLPFSPNGTPHFQPVWDYLLTTPVP